MLSSEYVLSQTSRRLVQLAQTARKILCSFDVQFKYPKIIYHLTVA